MRQRLTIAPDSRALLLRALRRESLDLQHNITSVNELLDAKTTESTFEPVTETDLATINTLESMLLAYHTDLEAIERLKEQLLGTRRTSHGEPPVI